MSRCIVRSKDRCEAGPFLFSNYEQELPTELTNEFLGRLVRLHLDRLTPEGWLVGGDVLAAVISGEYSLLCTLELDLLGLCASDQFLLRQCLAFFQKRVDIDLGIDRKAVALEKFRAAESACRLTNDSFLAWSQGRFQFRPEVERVLHAASLKISKVLGDCPTLGEIRPRFGPGATTQVPKRNACALEKLRHAPTCSANMAAGWVEPGRTATNEPLLGAALAEVSAWSSQSWVVNQDEDHLTVSVDIDVAKVAFVHKNAKTDRAICTEPPLNGMFQLGLGDYIASRLRTVGIDIRDQSANQRAALYGSISGASATLDLSSASDTVAVKLVEHLLPEDWFNLLWRLRSAEAEVDGKIVYMEKISSMGNGFTFPLETLIFWAIALSVSEIYAPRTRIRTLVYGDDIIVPVDAAVPLIRVLKDLGFTPNPDKSFWDGTFRESCGKDYVLGIDVRPVFVDGPLTGETAFTIHNYFVRRGDFACANIVELSIHPSIRLYGPQGYGDGHLHSDVWVARVTRKSDLGWVGFSFDTWTYSPNLLRDELVKRLLDLRERDSKDDRAKPKGAAMQLKRNKLATGKRVVPFKVRYTNLVRRLAAYVSYDQEDLFLDDHRPYADLVLPRIRPDTGGLRHLVVPGKGIVHRTRIYTFEPPWLRVLPS